MYHTIEILDGLMCVIDANGNEVNCYRLTSNRRAKQQIQAWALKYSINVAEAYRVLDKHFSNQRVGA